MDELRKMSEEVMEYADSLERKREEAISMAREIIRGTKHVIHAIHCGKPHDELLNATRMSMRKLNDSVGDVPKVLHSGVVQDAMMEFAEASILSSIVTAGRIPSYKELEITPPAWVLGLADSVGELRRMVLDSLPEDLEYAESLFKTMENIHFNIMMFDVSDAVIPIRHKQDVSRSVVEKTRADVTAARIMKG